MPQLDAPVLVAALEGWVDAGERRHGGRRAARRGRHDGRHLRPRRDLRLPCAPADPRHRRRQADEPRLGGPAPDRLPGRRPRPARPDRPGARLPMARALVRRRRARQAAGRRRAGPASGQFRRRCRTPGPVPVLATASAPRSPARRDPPGTGRPAPRPVGGTLGARAGGRGGRHPGGRASSPRSRTTSTRRTRRHRWHC